MQIQVLNAASAHHPAGRRDFHTVIVHIYVHFRPRILIIPMNQRVYQHLPHRPERIVALLFPPHTADGPRFAGIAADKRLGAGQKHNEARAGKFFVIQGVAINRPFSVPFHRVQTIFDWRR